MLREKPLNPLVSKVQTAYTWGRYRLQRFRTWHKLSQHVRLHAAIIKSAVIIHVPVIRPVTWCLLGFLETLNRFQTCSDVLG